MTELKQEERGVMTRRQFAVAAGASATAVAVAPLAKSATTKPRYGFSIDLDACIGCKACAVACKTEFSVPLGVYRSSVKEHHYGSYPNVKRDFVPWLCNHCKKPACIEVCPVDPIEATFTWPDGSIEKYEQAATYQRPDGIVLVNQERCIGCGQCVDACPYGVRFLNPAKRTVSKEKEGDHPAEKCTLCVHRLEKGLVPACVNTCQANARVAGDMNDPNSAISKVLRKKKTAVLLPKEGTDPQCHYVSLTAAAYSDGKDSKDEIW